MGMDTGTVLGTALEQWSLLQIYFGITEARDIYKDWLL